MNSNIDNQQSKPNSQKQKATNKNYYPVWFPYPHCWLKTIILLLSFCLIIFLLRIIGVISGVAILAMIGNSKDKILLNLPIILWACFLGLLFPVFLLAHIYQLLWSNPNPKLPSWMPNYRSLGEGIWGWFVSIFAVLMGVLILFSLDPHVFSSSYQNSELSDTQVTILSISWVFTSAYLYHFRRLICNSFKWLKKPKQQ
ncbi:hypothetical protein [Aphanothece sacrum]|uniref:Uncharacterized protein n=2 Tax=Aphanothece sacrum TaxID=1122 RepID=A0A401IE68_APHSA|nr:hypothetical protein [Aphanothece sacrum]GBF79567.1 hypothetical protein AsFPU1_0963 [Aphanothece sacrum FPU1]GBF86269.1 hypothetical protein AsFPU3_3340 [Aphanothece sacrum FPU3]